MVRLAAAVLLSYLLFTGVALLHAALGFGTPGKTGETVRRVQTVDLVRREPEKRKQAVQRMRRMQAPQGRGHAGGGSMAMRFSPDLAIDAPAGQGAEVTLQQQELTAEIFEQGQVDEQAIPEYTPPIPYPERAIDQEISGKVEVVFVITYQGKVSGAEVISSPSPLFSSAVLRGVAQWRFKPARKKGIPVNQRYRRVIEFQLQ
jgi:TonB family protein